MWRGKDKEIFVNNVFLSMGSNKGDREKNIVSALRLLEIGGDVAAVSSVYETVSMLRDNQQTYLNIVCHLETVLDPQCLLEMIHDIEDSLGRDRSVKTWGERTIDIDIIDFDGLILDEESLVIPHKEMLLRSFVLYPLQEICAEYIHPISKTTLGDMIKTLKDDFDIKRIGPLKSFKR